ncbi:MULTISPECIES: hypothetical protein [unclassified Duganella]|nr:MULTISPECIES: hypothetical protein [unclassified Duganella]
MNPTTGRPTPLGEAYARSFSRQCRQHFYRARKGALLRVARPAREG